MTGKFIYGHSFLYLMSLVDDVNEVMIEGMLKCRERTVQGFGRVKQLKAKEGFTDAAQILTEVDLLNQEDLLIVLYHHFPWISISVEERLDDPTYVQSILYSNDSRYMVHFDPVDGTFSFKHGLSDDFGIIGSLYEKTAEGEGILRSAAFYYPMLDEIILAKENHLLKGSSGKLEERRMIRPKHGKYFSSRNSLPAWTGLPKDSYRFGDEGFYSFAQAIRMLTDGELPGWLYKGSHLGDGIPAAWAARQFGADVEYLDGTLFNKFPWGDVFKDGKRKTQRDRMEILLVGDRHDPMWNFYKNCSKISQQN